MAQKPTLYEILKVSQTAGQADLQSAFRREFAALEAQRVGMNPQVFADKMQMLKLALNTLVDPASRLGYDAKLSAQAGQREKRSTALSLVSPEEGGPRTGGDVGADVRADALSLRADALSLRADAMLLRARVEAPHRSTESAARNMASGTLTGLKYFVRAIGLLVLMAVVAFMLTRCMVGGSDESRERAAAKAHEKTALQEYYQTYGVRPANMAELELLQAERQRRANEERANRQDSTKAQRDAREAEREVQERGRQVSEALRLAEDRAERERQREEQMAQMKLNAERAQAEERRANEDRRAERQQQQWREIIRR